MNARLILAGVATMVAFAFPCAVNGQDVVYGNAYGGAWYGYIYPGTYAGQSVPYFSVHPPVYYSYRVARTYGYSPFAYPPGVLTPGSQSPSWAPVQNGYTATAGETPEAQQGKPPLKIDNPFVDQPSSSGVTQERKSTYRQPQVIFPTAMARRAD